MIYYMIVKLSYKKGKNINNSEQWIITSYETVGEIMNKDKKTMKSLETRLYGKTYKSKKHIIIKEILSKTPLSRMTDSGLKDRG